MDSNQITSTVFSHVSASLDYPNWKSLTQDRNLLGSSVKCATPLASHTVPHGSQRKLQGNSGRKVQPVHAQSAATTRSKLRNVSRMAAGNGVCIVRMELRSSRRNENNMKLIRSNLQRISVPDRHRNRTTTNQGTSSPRANNPRACGSSFPDPRETAHVTVLKIITEERKTHTIKI